MSAHPGARHLVARTLASIVRPPEALPFESGSSATSCWSTARTPAGCSQFAGAPPLRGIAECLNEDHPANLVTVRKSQQSGVTTLAEAWCLYIADREPANTLYGLPNIDALRDLNSRSCSR
jgi:phage terminase large subunit GpA-like protein